MMKTLAIKNGRVITPDQVLEKATIIVQDRTIVAIQAQDDCPAGASILDAQGYTVAPGYIDVHVHGGAGSDTMDATPQALREMAAFFATHGVTSFLPTTVASDQVSLLNAIANVAAYQRTAQEGGAHVLGIHLEGPYLSQAYPGAQPLQHIRAADPAEYTRLFAHGNVRLISLAPEIPGNLALLEYARAQGATVAVGHSAASYEEVMQAVQLGLSQACHTFNGMSGLHHRTPGTVGAVLTCDAIYAQVIADLVHLHPAILQLLLKTKGRERIVLITDAIRAAGMPDGVYDLGGQSVNVSHGTACLACGNSLAGSVLTMDQAVRNFMAATGLTLDEVVPMASSVPAHSLHLAEKTGSLKPGFLADLILLDEDARVRATVVQGTLIYKDLLS